MNAKWLIVVLALASAPAFACKFDADCDIGFQCVKRTGQPEGTCTATRTPGSFDSGLSRDPTDPTRANQRSCDVDFDCGPMGKCMRPAGQVSGTCAGGNPGMQVPR